MNRRSVLTILGSFFVAPAALLAKPSRRKRRPEASCKDCKKCGPRCRCDCRDGCKCKDGCCEEPRKRRPKGCTCGVADSKRCNHRECRKRAGRNIRRKIRNRRRPRRRGRRNEACPRCRKARR